jgi:hypothetical protein
MKPIKFYSLMDQEEILINPDNVDYFLQKKHVPEKGEPPKKKGTMVYFTGSERPQLIKDDLESVEIALAENESFTWEQKLKSMYKVLADVLKELLPVWK